MALPDWQRVWWQASTWSLSSCSGCSSVGGVVKILVLADVPPAVVGGAEVQALRLAQHWASAGHDVLVAGPNNVEQIEGHLRVRRIPTLRATRFLRGVTYL